MDYFNQKCNRISPNMGPENYKSYTMRAPFETHWRMATCEEYECIDFLNGFAITVDTATELGKKQHYYLTHDNERSYSLQRVTESLFKFIYKPGNPCVKRADHRVPIGRPPLLLVVGGDWRGNPRGTPTVRHTRVEDWVDDFATHQEGLATLLRRG